MQEICGTVALCNRGSYAIHDLFLVGSINRASMQEDCGIITHCISVNQRGSYEGRL